MFPEYEYEKNVKVYLRKMDKNCIRIWFMRNRWKLYKNLIYEKRMKSGWNKQKHWLYRVSVKPVLIERKNEMKELYTRT